MNINPLLSDDIFISYSRWDGSTYAPGLADKLIQLGFSCFIDRYGTDPNRDLPENLRAKIRSCKMFVLIATERAAGSEAIEKEIREFQQTGRAARIVPIDIDGSLKSARWYDLVEGIAPELEKNPKALDDGDASPSVVSRIEKSFNYTRGKQRLRRATVVALFLLITLLAAGGGASVYALRQLKAATQAKTQADEARSEAERQKGAAVAAEKLAGEAGERQRKAEGDMAVAVHDKTVAENLRNDATLARDKAERQRVASEKLRDAARAEAQRQEEIAESGRQATRSQTLLKQKPLRLVKSVSAAVESMKHAVAARVESIGADSALRDSLALLPQYLGGAKLERGFVAVALSPDGRHFAAVTNTGKLQVFSVANPVAPLAEFPSEGGNDVAVSNGGEFVAADLDTTVRIFALRGGKSWEVPVKKAEGGFISLALSPQGKYLAVVYRERTEESEGGTIVASLVDAHSGKVVINLSGKRGMKINDVAFGPNGNLAVAGTRAGQNLKSMGAAAIWYLAEGTDWESRELESTASITVVSHEEENEIFTIAPGLDNTSFATSGYELTTIWKLGAGGKFEPLAQVPLLETIVGDESIVSDLAFDPEGSRLVTIRDLTPRDINVTWEKRRWTQALETWEARGHWESTRVLEPAEIKQVGFRAHGEVVSVFDETNTGGANVYQPIGGAEVVTSAMRTVDAAADVYPVKETADARVALISAGKAAQVWDFIRGTKFPIVLGPELRSPTCMAVSADDKFLVAAWQQKGATSFTLSVFSLTGGSYGVVQQQLLQQEPSDIAISLDGNEVVLLMADHSVAVRAVKNWNDLTPAPLRGIKGFEMIRLGPVGRHLVTVRGGGVDSRERLVQVWTIANGQEVTSIKDAAWVPVVEFSPGEHFLLTADEDFKTHLLDLQSLKLTEIINDANVYAGAFSVDERHFAIGSNEGELRILLTLSPETEVARLQHKGQINRIAFSSDNRFVATASTFRYPNQGAPEENALRVFLLRPQDLIDEAAVRIKSLSQVVR